MQELTQKDRDFVLDRLIQGTFDKHKRHLKRIKTLQFKIDEYLKYSNECNVDMSALNVLMILRNDFTREQATNVMNSLELNNLRFCDKCGKPMIEGYLTPDGDVFCSNECLEMTEEEVTAQYDDDDDCIFWTDWE